MKGKISTHLLPEDSSWFADTFLEFYRLHKAENLYYQIYSAGTHDIVQRLESRKDDVGFVYLMQNQKAAFSYYLARNYLDFFPLAQTVVMLYPGRKDKASGNSGSPVFDMYSQLSGLRLIQRFPDEFSPDNYWDLIDTDGNSIRKSGNCCNNEQRVYHVTDVADGRIIQYKCCVSDT